MTEQNPGECPRRMWEILIPTVSNDGRPFRNRYHRDWSDTLRGISGGLTFLAPAKGQWVSPTGELFQERMIPVRLLATETQIRDVIAMTIFYYDQLAILAYELSANVLLVHRDDVTKPDTATAA